jgi:hypothetical protein
VILEYFSGLGLMFPVTGNKCFWGAFFVFGGLHFCMCLDLKGVFLGLFSADGASVRLFLYTSPPLCGCGVLGRLGGSVFLRDRCFLFGVFIWLFCVWFCVEWVCFVFDVCGGG